MMVRVNLWPLSNVAHLQQVFAGFEALHRAGKIVLAYHYGAAKRFGLNLTGPLDPDAFLVVAEVENGPVVVFDTHDSARVCEPLYARCDFYFKRSHSLAEHRDYPKMRPLGPNLEIELSRASRFGVERAMRLPQERTRFRALARALRLPGNDVVDESRLLVRPHASADPHVLFVTRAWNPLESKSPDLMKTRDRLAISDMRAECIRRLRSVFGPRFTGGLYRDAFAAERYPDALVDANVPTDRASHLARLPRFDICVSSAGLHRSVGWKFAEYLASGRAVIAEQMAFGAPGGLTEGIHYLGFSTVEECVSSALEIAENHQMRQQMMDAAQTYYREWVSPPAMVEHALAAAMAQALMPGEPRKA